MSKIFLIGDSHISLGYPNSADKWHKVHIEYFNKFLIPLLKREVKEGDIVIHLGDLFDNRNVVPINLLNYGMSIVEEISTIAPLHILVGNHDCWHRSSSEITTVKPFKYIPNVFIYDKTTTIKFNNLNLCMMPYIENKEEQIKLIKDNLNCEYLFCHSDLNGARMHLTSVAHRNKNKIDIDEFSNFRRVFSGHIHITDRHRNFIFVGNNFEMDRNDYTNQKGIFVLDTDNDTEEFIPNNISPKFKKVYLYKEEDIEQIETKSDNWIDLYISSSLLVNNRKIRRKLEYILKDGEFESVNYIDDITIEGDEKMTELGIEDVITDNNLEGVIPTIQLEYTEMIKDYIINNKYDSDKIKNGVLQEFNEIVKIYDDNYQSNNE